ncbi:MAG: hypothetical protein K6G73_09025 [Marinilabiliaceae bacterium]|nr:hypothetical protein [Marinilabiliaceae bacterium]
MANILPNYKVSNTIHLVYCITIIGIYTYHKYGIGRASTKHFTQRRAQTKKKKWLPLKWQPFL